MKFVVILLLSTVLLGTCSASIQIQINENQVPITNEFAILECGGITYTSSTGSEGVATFPDNLLGESNCSAGIQSMDFGFVNVNLNLLNPTQIINIGSSTHFVGSINYSVSGTPGPYSNYVFADVYDSSPQTIPSNHYYVLVPSGQPFVFTASINGDFAALPNPSSREYTMSNAYLIVKGHSSNNSVVDLNDYNSKHLEINYTAPGVLFHNDQLAIIISGQPLDVHLLAMELRIKVQYGNIAQSQYGFSSYQEYYDPVIGSLGINYIELVWA